jgi:hypothetical protein
MPFNECQDVGPQKPFNLDDPNPLCSKDCETQPSLKDVNGFFDDIIHTKKGIGAEANCDPMQRGQIVNDLAKKPNRNTIYRYSKAIRGCDEAVKDLFSDIIVIDEQGVAHPVPIIWSTQERAVAAVIQENVRKDTSLVVDRVKLPIMSIYSNNFTFNQNRYTYHQVINHFKDKDGNPSLTIREKQDKDTVLGLARGIPIDIGYSLTMWTYFTEDMNQILEQIVLKFSPIAYIKIQGVQWETIVKLDSISNNLDTEPGNTANRVVKFQINMTAETYVPQPITRHKAILKTRIDITDGLSDEDITQIISRIEGAIGEL